MDGTGDANGMFASNKKKITFFPFLEGVSCHILAYCLMEPCTELQWNC